MRAIYDLDFSKVENKTIEKAPYYTSYKGIYYRYDEFLGWRLSDRQDGMGRERLYMQDLRIDECLKLFNEGF